LSQNASPVRHVVTLVVVVHDGARLLPGLVSAVREQTYPVYRAVGVDTGSQDRTGATLAELLGPDAVFGMDPETGYGAAIARALQHPAARTPVPESVPAPDANPAAPPGETAEWIWLLHDDCEPAADTLEQLLRAATRGRPVAVVGPKLRDAADRQVLRETGLTVDRAGRRLTGIEPGEIDQGQHDANRAVLAVSSAGMLIRRDVWDQLGGFDPNLPLMRDDIDFCWRAHAAGYEVRVAADAVLYHRELSARQVRSAPAAGGHARLADRRGALYVFAANLPVWPMLVIVAGCVAGSVLRAACFLATKQQRRALDHLGAVGWLLRHPVLVARARRRRAAGRSEAWQLLRGQVPRGRTLSRLAESAAGLLSGAPAYESRGLHQALTDDVDELPLAPSDPVLRRLLFRPGVLLFAGLAVIALVAERTLTGSVLTGSGTLAGGALAPAWGGASDLWREYLAGYHGVGVGSAASTPPYVAALALLSTVLAGKPWLAVDVILLGSVPAAGLTAYRAARRLTPRPAARVWLAAAYALLPVAMGAVAAGRIGTLVALVILPLTGLAAARMLDGRPPGARRPGGRVPGAQRPDGLPAPVPSRFTPRRAAWAAGLLIAVAAAFVPLLWVIAVAAALAAAAAWPWLGRAAVLNVLIAAAVPAVLLVPWTFHLVASPSALLLEAGLQRPGLAAAGLSPGSVLLLRPGGPGLPPAWVTAGLVLLAFGALLARRRRAVVYAGWAVALTGLVLALVVSRIQVTGPGGTTVSAWPGIATALAAAGLLLAAAPVIEAAAGALGALRDQRRADGLRAAVSWPALAVLGAVVLAVSAPLLAAGYWLAAGVRGPVAAAGPQVLPPFVAAASAATGRPRTLILRQNGPVLSYTVLRSSDPVLGEPELTEAASATSALNGAVAALAAAAGGDGGDAGQALRQFDIGYVLLPAPVDPSLASQLDGAAGLIPLTSAPSYDLWQVSGPVARVTVAEPGGAVLPLPAGPVGVDTVLAASTSGTLVLAEAAGGWSATLNGRPLARLSSPVDGWAQGFVLPAGGGHLVITRDQTARALALAVEAVAVLAVAVLALPGTRSAAVAAAAAAAATGPVGAEPGPGDSPAAARRRSRAARPASARRTRRRVGFPAGRPHGAPAPNGAATSAPNGAATSAPNGAATSAGVPVTGAVDQSGYATGAQWSALDPARPELAPVEAAPARRSRGQHAARHGKSHRRGRGLAVANLDLVTAGEDAGRPAALGYDPTAAGPPRESGDDS
jgi:GT2 family glycosyltransferase